MFSLFIYTVTGRPLTWMTNQATVGAQIGISGSVTKRVTLIASGDIRDGLWDSRKLPVIKAMDVAAAAAASMWPIALRLGAPYALLTRAVIAPAF